MRPPWPRLALRSLLGGGPEMWPCCGLGWPRQEWPGVAKLLKPSHLVSFRLIPLVDWGWGFTLILSFSPQGRRDLTVFTGTTGVGGATAGSRLSRWDGGRLRWCTLATPGIGPGRSRPRHACRNLGGVCQWVTHAEGTEPGLCCSIGIIVLALWHICNW